MYPAIVLLEFDSIALGIEAGDAMVKRAPLAALHAGTVHPGRYLVLAGGEVADVEEAREAGRQGGRRPCRDEIFLADVHPGVVEALTGSRRPHGGDSLGVIETSTAAATIGAADAALKGAVVELLEIRLSDGLGGKAYALLGGSLPDVQAAVDAAVASLHDPGLLVGATLIPRLHEEMRENLEAAAEFGARIRMPALSRV